MKNRSKNLNKAKQAKNDEFYTQMEEINKELGNYKNQLANKIILCNCDDPFESNFFKYLALNFESLKLKKLISISYANSPITGKQLSLLNIAGLKPECKGPYAVEINAIPDLDNDGAMNLNDVKLLLEYDKNVVVQLKGDGDFRSDECIEYLKKSDIVITNPPFSLFREYVAQLIEYDKKFLIIGSHNAITYKGVFESIKDSKIWLGESGRVKLYQVPDYYEGNAIVGEDGKKYIDVSNTCWYTNLDVKKRHSEIPLFQKYYGNEKDYPTYDNYDAIEISRVKDIPVDYDGVMGVPITFLHKYNPEQFELIGQTGVFEPDGICIKHKAGRPYINGQIKYARLFIKRI